ncbi:MAG TPA: DUF2272 domain-containing protein [Candidatus Aquabacterium excrementipullorum]|nr:DUF2272 domain-containing protein [Candidatus Aquabacterium excrementipullorum]
MELQRLRAAQDAQAKAPAEKRQVLNPTILVALIGVAGTVLAAILQASNGTALEREKLRSTLITKAIDFPNPDESLKYLRFLQSTKLVDGIETTISNYEASPDQIPNSTTKYSLLNPSVDAAIRSAPLPKASGSQRGFRALEKAQAELRGSAREVDDNAGQWVQKYLAPLHMAPQAQQGFPWAIAFISWCFTEDGQTPFQYSPSANAVYTEFKQKNWLLKAGETPQPGDVVFWSRDKASVAAHAAIVHHAEGGKLYTIAGNVGNLVQAADSPIDRANVLGFGRVPDQDTPRSPPP